jgi:hypothetical protein
MMISESKQKRIQYTKKKKRLVRDNCKEGDSYLHNSDLLDKSKLIYM